MRAVASVMVALLLAGCTQASGPVQQVVIIPEETFSIESDWEGPPPVNEMTIAWSPDPPRQGQELSFAMDSDRMDRPIATVWWTFGDGTNSTDPFPYHIYTAAGDYTVTVQTWDRDGWKSGQGEDTVTILEPL